MNINSQLTQVKLVQRNKTSILAQENKGWSPNIDTSAQLISLLVYQSMFLSRNALGISFRSLGRINYVYENYRVVVLSAAGRVSCVRNVTRK